MQLLRDAEELDDAHTELKTGSPGRQYGLASLNRAVVVMSVSAWESDHSLSKVRNQMAK
jgi:hypothetical protein